MKRKISTYLLAAATAAALTGCGFGDDNSDPRTTLFYDMVTCGETTPEGVTSFTFRAVDDSPEVTLTADWTPADTTIVPGQRLLLAYRTEVHNRDAHVEIAAWLKATGGQLKSAADISGWDDEPVWVNAIWRSGHYINLDCRLEYSAQPATFDLVLDSATAHTPDPVAYLFHRRDSEIDGFQRRVYASWDIARVWQQPSVHTLTIRLRDSNRDIQDFRFTKSQPTEPSTINDKPKP